VNFKETGSFTALKDLMPYTHNKTYFTTWPTFSHKTVPTSSLCNKATDHIPKVAMRNQQQWSSGRSYLNS